MPLRDINPNLDQASQAQMFQIAAREAIETLEKKLSECLLSFAKCDIVLDGIRGRIEVLEEARKIQIKINDNYLKLINEKEARKELKVESKSFWPWK